MGSTIGHRIEYNEVGDYEGSSTSSAKIDPSTLPPSPRVGYLDTGAFTGPVGERF